MPRHCTVCDHAERQAIDEALLRSETYRKIAQRFETSITALHRHKQSHIPKALAKAQEAQEVARGDSLLDRLRELNRETTEVLRAARRSAADLPLYGPSGITVSWLAAAPIRIWLRPGDEYLGVSQNLVRRDSCTPYLCFGHSS